jgi:hypothetical protein
MELDVFVNCSPANQMVGLIAEIRRITDNSSNPEEALRDIAAAVDVAERRLLDTPVHIVRVNTATKTSHLL